MGNSGKKGLLSTKNGQDGVVVLLLGIALCVYSFYMYYTAKVVTEWKMSPYLFPVLISVFAIALSVSLFADAKRELVDAVEKKAEPANLKKVVIVVALAVAYYVLLDFITFIPATIVYLVAMFIFFGERKWWLIALLAAATSGIIYVLFGMLLHVRLP